MAREATYFRKKTWGRIIENWLTDTKRKVGGENWCQIPGPWACASADSGDVSGNAEFTRFGIHEGSGKKIGTGCQYKKITK